MLGNYTTELRTYIEHLPVNEDQSISHRKAIENGRKHLFDFDYPMFDENYKNVFETNFIRNFYLRQIGFDTIGLFKFNLETWLAINMPYFNNLFESELLQFDPLTNTKLDETYTKTDLKHQSDSTIVTSKKDVDSEGNTVKANTGNTDKSNSGILDKVNTGNLDKINTGNTDVTQTGVDSNTNSKIKSVNESGSDISSETGTSSLIGESKQISNVSGSSDTNQNQDVTGKAKESAFNRDLTSDTPDGRLGITASDGVGVIEYASEIKEKTDKLAKDTESNTKNTGSETTKTDGTNTANDKSNAESNNNVNRNTTYVHDSSDIDTARTTKDNNEKVVVANNENVVSRDNENVTNSSNENIIASSNETGNIKNNLTQLDSKDEGFTSDINTTEDYVNYRFGKVGQQSFSKMVMEYRSSLMRIEKQIFDEMQELFMLVY